MSERKSPFILQYTLLILFILAKTVSTNAYAAKTVTVSNEILVSAAMSLKGAITEIASSFERNRSLSKNKKITFNFASSGQLRAQIETGAPVDIFLPASTDDLNILEKKDLIINESNGQKSAENIWAKNQLVLAVNVNNLRKIAIKDLNDLTAANIKNIAIGNPSNVPVGQYAKESMEYFKIYEKVKSKLVFGENARQVLDYISRNEVDAGLVFFTDAISDKMVSIVLTVPSNAYRPIVYPIGILKSSKNQKLAKEFAEYLSSKDARNILKKHGFFY